VGVVVEEEDEEVVMREVVVVELTESSGVEKTSAEEGEVELESGRKEEGVGDEDKLEEMIFICFDIFFLLISSSSSK
jgi:hypothetical protein